MPKKSGLKVAVISDTHCGHNLGLTPPAWDSDNPVGSPARQGRWRFRRMMWDWFEETVKQLRPFDVLIVNGDAIDGKGQASGGAEQMYMDRTDQVDMAKQVIQVFGRKPTIYMSYGTAYHTGKGEDWEDLLASLVGAEKIGSEDNLDIRGTIINYRHHLSRSMIPHGRFTAVAREKLWNTLWAARGEYPLADIIIRSHVHYFGYCGTADWLALTTPSLQGYGTKYGARRMTGTVDLGFVTFEVFGKADYSWQPHILRAPLHPAIEVVEDADAA